MSSPVYQILEVNLSAATANFHRFADSDGLLGGLGLALQLLKPSLPEAQVVLSVGPLNGLFPFVSKYCCLSFDNKELTEFYGSGRLSLIMKFAQIDAVIIYGTAREPTWVSVKGHRTTFYEDDETGRRSLIQEALPGRRSILSFSSEQSLTDDYFIFETTIGRRLYLNNLLGLSISADRAVPLVKPSEYDGLYQEILRRGRELEVSYGQSPSCGGCPAGCDLSHEVEHRPELILSHCLVACGFAQGIYESEATVFACLDSLGYRYKHEDLELVVAKVERLRRSFS